ncbi:MAG TPA: DUF4124 domain-containing protein [Woeseiaceae bacterium]
MRKTLFLGCSLLLAASALLAEEAYRWVDAEGVVHYSDRPQPGAEQVQLESAPPPGTRVRSVAPSPRQQSANDEESGDATGYESLTVSSPAAEETLWNIGGTLDVTLDLQPSLQPGHRVRLYFDGEVQEVSGLQFQIAEVYRGVHNIQAEVVDANGELKIRSQTNRFYVQQTTVVN